MKKTTLTRALFMAGAVALAGAANADAIFYPDGTMVDLGSDTALEQMAMGTCETCVDTTALGAGSATMTTTTTTAAVPVVRYEYVQPNIDFDAATARAQMRMHRDKATRSAVVSDSSAIVVGSATIPYSSITVGQPYYVMSY